MEYFLLLVGVMFGFHLHSTDEHYRTELTADVIQAETAGATHLVIVLNSEQLLYG